LKKSLSGVNEKPYDIQQRTFLFGLNIIRISEHLPLSQVGKILCNQLVRSETSIGANMEEVTAASSKQDFIYKANISLREARETNYWLRIIKESRIINSPQVDELVTESLELMKILSAIVSKARGKRKV